MEAETPSLTEAIDPPLQELTAKQKRFCEEYIIDLNATQAAIRTGYSEKTARAIGYENLTKPHIKAYIKVLLDERTMSGDEAVKLIGDIAKSSMNDYFVVKEVKEYPLIKKPLIELIIDLQKEVEFEREFAAIADYDEDEMKGHLAAQKSRSRKILRMQLELKHNPDAFRMVESEEPIMVECAELDLVKLVKDKENGRIKSFSHDKYGPKVELYGADGALRDIMKVTGKLNEVVKVANPDGTPINNVFRVEMIDTRAGVSDSEKDIMLEVAKELGQDIQNEDI